jgi:CubicO group peptidase (beta-lactamase class C family)
MIHTTLRPLVAMTYPLAQGHEETPQGPKIVRPAANNAASWPAGSMFSNVLDLSRFVIAFVNDGKIDGHQVLSTTLIRTLSTPHAKIPGGDVSYGYGVEVATYRGVDVVRHGGSRSGYGSIIRMVPARRFGVIVLANRTGVGLSDTADKAMEIALSLEPAKPVPKRVPMPLSAMEALDYIGTYSQGLVTLEIIRRDGQLFLKQQTRETPLGKIGDDDLQAADGSRYIVVRGGTGTVDYLYGGGRSWRKLP